MRLEPITSYACEAELSDNSATVAVALNFLWLGHTCGPYFKAESINQNLLDQFTSFDSLFMLIYSMLTRTIIYLVNCDPL